MIGKVDKYMVVFSRFDDFFAGGFETGVTVQDFDGIGGSDIVTNVVFGNSVIDVFTTRFVDNSTWGSLRSGLVKRRS